MSTFPVDVSDVPFALPADKRGRHKNPIDHVCKLCGLQFQSRNPRQFYCEPCSESQDLKRKKLTHARAWSRGNRDKKRDTGILISRENAKGLEDVFIRPQLRWHVRYFMPFSWSASKNALYTSVPQGHVALRRKARKYRDDLIYLTQHALRGQRIVQNKLWIDIFVEKASNRGDAVNLVDTICDAIKVATGLDDRWFCIRSLDWSINKDDPQVIIGIGQETDYDIQNCSYCGRLLGLHNFSSNRFRSIGVARTCKDCERKQK